MEKIRVTFWNEFRHEKKNPVAMEYYPNGIHAFVKDFVESSCDDIEVTLTALDDENYGITDELLDNTDVLIWWAHTTHKELPDELAIKIRDRVMAGGMGFIALHSSHRSKPFGFIVGTNGNLSWGRNQREIMWNMMPSHPIAEGIPNHFIIEKEELYAEPFYVPQPDELVFSGWYEDGYIFRSGLCYYRGIGKIFYFQPGHETCKSFYNPYVQRIIINAIRWASPAKVGFKVTNDCPRLRTAPKDEFDAE
ncbi:MAG: ThuA domain-containing protein [Clostridia bacterium]|nr:ThuA domain-containing protein [Clostridia bacterium]